MSPSNANAPIRAASPLLTMAAHQRHFARSNKPFSTSRRLYVGSTPGALTVSAIGRELPAEHIAPQLNRAALVELVFARRGSESARLRLVHLGPHLPLRLVVDPVVEIGAETLVVRA